MKDETTETIELDEPEPYLPYDNDDPIIDEIRRIRAAQAASYGYDIGRQVRDSRRLQFLFGNDVVRRNKVTGEMELVHKGNGKDMSGLGALDLGAPK